MTLLLAIAPPRVDQYDVRASTVREMLELGIVWYPEHFGHVVPHDPKSALLELQVHLGLLPSLCVEYYNELSMYYGLRGSELNYCRVRRPGMTVGDLHRLLWHTANAWQFGKQQEYWIPYPRE